MSQVLSAKLTDKHLSNNTLIYSWSTICIYALFAYGPRQCCLLPIIPLWSPSVGTSELAYPKKPRTLITLKCLDTSVLNTDKNHLITLSPCHCRTITCLTNKSNHFLSAHTDIQVTTAHAKPLRKSTHFLYQYTSPLATLPSVLFYKERLYIFTSSKH
jgi:hypothetical protein